MSILGHVKISLSDLERERIREKIEAREREDAIQRVVDGDDLDYGRVSRMEWIATAAIEVDAEDIDALLCDGDQAQRVRDHIDEQVAKLTRQWLDTYRGQAWLEQKVADCLEDELEDALETMKEQQAEAENDRAAGIFEEGGKR